MKKGNFYVGEVATSVPFDNSTNGFTSTDTQAAIEEARQYSEGFPRAGIRATCNGIVSNNQWIGPTELLPNTPLILFPVNVAIKEITWSNQTTNVQFRLQFRTGSKTGAIFYTLTVTSPNPGYGYVGGLNFVFAPGVPIYCQYLDDGQNASDFDLILWIARIP